MSLKNLREGTAKTKKTIIRMNRSLNHTKNVVAGVGDAFGGMAGKAVQGAKLVGKAYTDQLLKPIEAITDTLNSLAGVDLSNLMSYGRQLNTIAETTRTIVHEQVAWEQQLIGIYKQTSEVAKGSYEIVNNLMMTNRVMTKNIIQWMKWGGITEGVQLAVQFAEHSIANIHELSNDSLLNWHKQNKALGITSEESAKIAGYQSRGGISLKESLSFQVELFNTLKKTFKSNSLTSKMMSSIANSEWAIMNYSKGNVAETVKIAAHAHAWKVEIDEIYSMTQAMAESEKAIETSRKAQLMFGIDLNARQMQYMAQTGKEEQLSTMLLDSFRDMNTEFDDLTLTQRRFIADTIASGDINKARIMLLGRESELTEDLTPPLERQTNLLAEQVELQKLQNDYLAAYQTKYAAARVVLWTQ